MYDEIVAATGICANKSSLATILANPIYRGIKVFNRETRVEGEHGRKRRRNPQQDVVTSEVEAIVPDQLWNRVQDMLTRRRANRLPLRRYAGRYVLTELLRCACGSRMAGTNSRERRYYRCLARCGRPQVRADHLEAGVLDRIRATLFTPDAIREMVTLLNEDIRLRAEHRGPDLDRARAQVRTLEQRMAAGLEPATKRLTAAGLIPRFVLRIAGIGPIESHVESHPMCRYPRRRRLSPSLLK